jgi:uncharacterized protein YkwD
MKFGIVLLATYLAVGLMPSSQSGQPTVQIKSLERRIFDLVNMERVKAKRLPLNLDPKLSDIARAHSGAMAREHFFAHENPAGQGPDERAHSAGYECHHQEGRYIHEGIGENILQNNLYSREFIRGRQITYEWNTDETIALTTVRGWMESPDHRVNLLSEAYVRSGIGIAISTDLKVLVTQDFC